MKKAFLFIILLATSQVIFAQSKFEKKQAAAKSEVEALERQRFAAQVSKDFDFLGRVFADDLIYTHSGGKKIQKKRISIPSKKVRAFTIKLTSKNYAFARIMTKNRQSSTVQS